MSANEKTVGWLIAELQRLAAEDASVTDRVVWLEGCDCEGRLTGVRLETLTPGEPGEITLTRSR